MQRGSTKIDLVINTDGGAERRSQSIPINHIDTKKSLLIIYSENQQRNTDAAGSTKTITLSDSSITFSLAAPQYYTEWIASPLFWQVVEFY